MSGIRKDVVCAGAPARNHSACVDYIRKKQQEQRDNICSVNKSNLKFQKYLFVVLIYHFLSAEESDIR